MTTPIPELKRDNTSYISPNSTRRMAEVASDVEDFGSNLKVQFNKAVENVPKLIRNRPYQSLVAGCSAGIVLGYVMNRAWRK
jgi:ElaB/YqjD/DUF883 family membrane-anchored ribosome-binding protein